MFNPDVEKRIEQLNPDCVVISDSHLEILESKKEGYAKVNIAVTHPCLSFLHLEDKKLQYFKCGNCADALIFENIDTDNWILHIIEFKRTVKSTEWQKIKKQFEGACLNAYALAGYLSINQNIRGIKLYTGYRFDRILEHLAASPIEQRALLGKPVESPDISDWKGNLVTLHLFDDIDCLHTKLKLDTETGELECAI